MDTDIEWLFEEVYKHQQERPNEKLYFLSDWDCDVDAFDDFKQIIQKAYSDSISHSFKYAFAYEQFDLKSQIVKFCDTLYNFEIPESCITITPSATQAIYLSLKALKKVNVNKYLVFTPAYFSTFESLKENNSSVYYYHLTDRNNFVIDFVNLEKILKEQYIECIILTDPIFSAGMEIPDFQYKLLALIAQKLDIYLWIDYSLGGLQWERENLFILNHNKLRELMNNSKFVFIDSLSKRLQLNGIKFSLVIGSPEIIDGIDTISESIYGGLNGLQTEVIKQLYTPSNNQAVINMHNVQLNKIQDNYRLVKTLIQGEPCTVANSNSGFFTIIYSNQYTFDQLDTKKIIYELLKEEHILAIPNNRFSYYSDNKFGWRVNLSKDKQDLLIALRKSIRKVFGRFYN